MKKNNKKKQELQKATIFLIISTVVLLIAAIFVLYFSGITKDGEYADSLDYTNQANFSYDVTKVNFDKDGATLTNSNDQATVILMNPIRLSDQYGGNDKKGRLLEFQEEADKSQGTNIYYQLAVDGKNWLYHNDQGWQNVGTCEDCYNSSFEINSYIKNLEVKSDTLSIKAFLVSESDNRPVLKKVNLRVKGEDLTYINKRVLNAELTEAYSSVEAIHATSASLEPAELGSFDCPQEVVNALLAEGKRKGNVYVWDFTFKDGWSGHGASLKTDAIIHGMDSVHLSCSAEYDEFGYPDKGRPDEALGDPAVSNYSINKYKVDLDREKCELHKQCGEIFGPICGDGNLDPGEQCDDGNNVDGDGCSAQCTLEPYCGDGNLDEGEQCDDGNNQNGDGCSAECTTEPYCGDGNLDEGEQCDDGNNVDGDGCDASCNVEPYCGDGNLDEGEQCDDGNNNNGDGCSSECTTEQEPYCGDGILNQGEQCDDGNNVDGDGCDADCSLEPYCGDGSLDEGEQCDDGNNVDGDGCDKDCKTEEVEPYCGDGNIDEGEQCDDGNNVDGDGCSSTCTNEKEPLCGDGILHQGEQCDDGNNVDGDGCDKDCKTEEVEPYCGDGNLDEGEQCDDGNNIDGDGCSAQCTTEGEESFCGNGVIEGDEQCDDGNGISGDGCSSTCDIEKTPLIVPTTLTLPPPEPITISPDLIGLDDGLCGVTYEQSTNTFSGFLNGNYGPDTILQYSLNNKLNSTTSGLSWRTISDVSDLGSDNATFRFTLQDYSDGDYDLIVRAVPAEGDIIGSVNCPFTINTGGCDLIFGANEFVLESQQGPMLPSGLIEFRKNESQRIWIEAKDVTSFDIVNLDKPEQVFSLVYDENVHLWTGELIFNETGLFRLEGRVSNNAGCSYSREINSVFVTRGTDIKDYQTGELLEATITIYEKDVYTNNFVQWNGSAYGQSNPFIASNGQLSVILPQGEFYIEVSHPSYNTVTSLITKIADQSLVKANVNMVKRGLWERLKSLIRVNDISNNFPLIITPLPRFSLLEVGEKVPSIIGHGVDDIEYNLLDELNGNSYKILMTYSDWNTESQEQAEIYANIIDSINSVDSNIKFAAISTMPPDNVIKTYLERGGYDIEFFTPNDKFFDDYMIISLPHFFVLNKDNELLGMVVGSYSAKELTGKLLGIINQ